MIWIKHIKSAFKWFETGNNKKIVSWLLIALLAIIILMQKSCNSGLRDEIERQKLETQRITNNFEASNDTIRHKKINDSTILAERLAFKLTIEELKNGYSDLLVGFEDFKKQNPKVIEKIYFNNTETIKEVTVYAKIDSLGKGFFSFNDSIKFADGNFRKLKGSIPFSSKYFKKIDSSEVDFNTLGMYQNVIPGFGNFELEQGIKLKVGLFEDPKSHKVSIAVTTSYPGITFTQLEGADIMSDDISKKAARNFRKNWSAGLYFGYGVNLDLRGSSIGFGPQMGVGIKWAPKWLQWGK